MSLPQSKNQSKNNPINLNVQWHITTNCSNRCKHCYMYDEKTFEDEKKNTLSLKDLIKILDDFKNFEKKYNAKFAGIACSGGDPLLREDSFEFFHEIRKRDIYFSLMGNPETLNEKVISKLKSLDISSFQMSLDGLEKMHDFFRTKGSFQRTVEATKFLKKYGISCNIMFTLYPTNANELIPLMSFVAEHTEATSFSFDMGCFVGEAKTLSKSFTLKDIRKIFSKYLEHKSLLERKHDIMFLEKSNLLKIIRLEKGLFNLNFTYKIPVISGCLSGWNPPAILADGTLLICRSLPIVVGKMPEDSFEEVFLNNSTVKKFRRRFFFEGCKDCDLYSICRGCPANVYSLTGNPFAENPLCFRKDIKNKQVKNERFFVEPDLNTTNEEEWNFVKLHMEFRQNYLKYLQNKDFQYIYLELAQNISAKNKFLNNPNKFIKDKKYNLSQVEISWLKYKFGEELAHNNYNIKSDGIAKQAIENIIKDIYC